MNMAKAFSTFIASEDGKVFIPVPFDPDVVWGKKPRHLVAGQVNDSQIRGPIVRFGKKLGIPIGPAWQRSCGFEIGMKVSVTIAPEGPQRDALAPDIAAALENEPKAAEFFDGLAQFYRKAYLKWIDSTKRNPDERVRRIKEFVKLLKAGAKER